MTFEQKIETLWDIHEIQNLMSRYAQYHTGRQHEKTAELFDLEREDCWLECGGMGVYKGPKGVRSFFIDWHHSMEWIPEGACNIHTLTSPYIEVAGDRQTAKAVWISPGAETRRVQPDAHLESIWIWGKYAVDFCRDKDGNWKFWHFTITNDFMCDYHHSWVECENNTGATVMNNGVMPSDAPNTFADGYTKGMIKDIQPPIPEPYETY